MKSSNGGDWVDLGLMAVNGPCRERGRMNSLISLELLSVGSAEILSQSVTD